VSVPNIPGIYELIPDLARLMRTLEWELPIGDVRPGSAADLHYKICRGIGAVGSQTAVEYEKLLHRHLAVLQGIPAEEDAPAALEQAFVLDEGVNACAYCRQTMIDGIIAHKLDCEGLRIRRA
jgi:hypothetical protein